MRDKLCLWIARRLPKRLMYWCYIRVHAAATCGKYPGKTPDEVSWKMALDAWDVRI